MTTTLAKFLAAGRSHEGTRETGSGNRNPFTEWLHRHKYRNTDGENWCADYQAFLDYTTGNDVPSHSAACSVQADAYKTAHRWSDAPALGAKAFFYSPSENGIHHIGHVVAYTASTVTVQSGNWSNRVATVVFRRHLSEGFRIVGYGLPRFTPVKGKHRIGNIDRILKVGTAGAGVARVQRLVGAHADGIFGPKTKAAVERWQKAHHLTPDGEFGPKSAHAAGWAFRGKR